jgi:hypothetical protein
MVVRRHVARLVHVWRLHVWRRGERPCVAPNSNAPRACWGLGNKGKMGKMGTGDCGEWRSEMGCTPAVTGTCVVALASLQTDWSI